MKSFSLFIRSALAVAALGTLGTAVASEGMAKYYSLQASAKSYTMAGNGGAAPVVLVRYKTVASTATASSAKQGSSGSAVAAASHVANGNEASFNKSDSYESVGLSSLNQLASTGSKTNTTTTTPSTWGFTNSGNYSITTANGGVALNNVYVGGDLNITVNVSGGTWNTSCHGGTCHGPVSPC